MRILYLTDGYRPARSACANRTVVLVDALCEAGHDVRVLASSDSLLGASEGYEPPGHVAFFETFPLREKTLVNRLRNNFGSQRASVDAAEKMGNFDIVVCTTPPLLLAASAMKIARKKRARLVWDVRDVWPDVAYEMGAFGPRSPYGLFFLSIANRMYKAADLVVSVSEGKVAKIRARMPEGRAGDVALVPNGIDESLCDLGEDEALVARLGFGDGRPACVYVGNVGLAQGLGTLLDIAVERPSVRFLVFGEGANRAALERRVLEEDISNVEFCGIVGESGVKAVLSHATLAYVPLASSKLRDSVPTKLYEAFACGCPVVLAAATDGDAAALLADCGLGACAAPEDSVGIGEAFDQVLSAQYSDEEREVMRRAVVEKHSRQRFAREFAALVGGLEVGA